MGTERQRKKKVPQKQGTPRISEGRAPESAEREFRPAQSWTELPELSANRSLRQAMILDLQASHGNAYVNRFLADATIRRKSLADLKRATRKKMKVVQTLPIPQPSEESITKKSKDKLEPVKIIFDRSVPEKVRVALNNVAVEVAFAQPEIKAFTTYTADLDLTKIKGGKNIYRFSWYKESKKEFILIELVGPSGAAKSKSKADDGKKKFKNHGFKFRSFADAEKGHLFAALALIPDSSLSKLAGLSFQRLGKPAGAGKDQNAGGTYLEKTHTIVLYDKAFASNVSSLQTKAIVHEIGHAISLQTAAAGYKEKKEAEKALKKARTSSAGDTDDPLAFIKEPESADQKKAEAKLKAAEKKIARAKDGSESPTFKRVLKAEGAVSKYGEKNREEAYAEAYTLFIVDPAALKAIRPKTHRYFANLDIYFKSPGKLKKRNRKLYAEFKKHYGG